MHPLSIPRHLLSTDSPTRDSRAARGRRLVRRLVPGAAIALLAAGCAKEAPLVTRPASPPAHLLFERVSVLDVPSGRLVASQDVLVSGERIAAVGNAGTLDVPAGAARIDGRGATLMPGLVDSHGHVANGSAPPSARRLPDPDRNLQAYLYCGVTTVLDPADLANAAFARRDAVAAGTLLGPRILAAGPMLTAEGGHPLPVLEALAPWWIRWYVRRHAVRPLATAADAEAAVRELAEAGADFVKIAVDGIPNGSPILAPPLARAVVEAAHARGLRVVAHIGTLADAMAAGEAGVDAFVHMVYKEPLDADSAARLAAFGVPVVATMGVFENYALSGRRPREATLLERETVDAEVLAAFGEAPAADVFAEFRDYFELLHTNRLAWRENIRLMRAAGITVLAGSDSQTGVFPGPGLHRELALLVESGMTPGEALRSATLDAARFLDGKDDPDFGIVAAGKRADLLLVEGNPAYNLSALSRIRAVVQQGVVLERHPLPGSSSPTS